MLAFMIETFFQKILKHFFTSDFSFIEDLQKYILIVFLHYFHHRRQQPTEKNIHLQRTLQSSGGIGQALGFPLKIERIF